MSDLTALIARADYALGLEDHLWTDWRALVIDLRDALTAAEAQPFEFQLARTEGPLDFKTTVDVALTAAYNAGRRCGKPMPEGEHWQSMHGARDEILKAAEAQRRTVEQERDKARRFIEGRGYRRCDIAACNCHSYHGGHAEGLA
jgi:hypothetical protein